MNHDFYGPAWADNHAKLSDAVALFFAAGVRGIGTVFERLHAYQYDAPWQRQTRRVKARAK